MKGFLQTQSGRVAYQLSGDTKQDAIAFIHGNTLDQRMWEPQIRFFKEKYRLLTFDLLGFGLSDAPSENYSRHGILKELIEYLEIPEVTLIGLSLGGDVAIDFALEFPSNTKSLVLLSSGLGGWAFSESFKQLWNQVLELAKTDMERSKEFWLSSDVFRTLSPENLALVRDMVNDYSGWHWFNKNPRIKPELDAKDSLGKIKLPTLIIYGEKDVSDFEEIAQFLAAEIPNNKLVSFPNAGHMVNLERAESVNEEIVRFLQDV